MTFRDASGREGGSYSRGAGAPPPPQVMLGTPASDVFIQVDFALREK